MRIAFVAELFHPHLGGAEFRAFQFAKGLASRGHRVTAYTVDYTDGSLPEEETVDGVRIVRWTRIPGYIGPHGRSVLGMMRFGDRAGQLLTDGVSEENDAVVVNQWPLLHLLGVRQGRLPSTIAIDWCEWWDEPVWRPVFAHTARQVPSAVAVECHVANRVRAANPSGHVEVVRTPVPLSTYTVGTQDKDRDLIVFVGRVAPQKRVDRLAEAVVHLNETQGARKRLAVLGDGEQRKVLEARFARYPYIRFLGCVSEETKAQYLRRAWILGLCSRREGMPITLMEAIASGTPVVTVRSPLNTSNELVEAQGIGIVAPSARAADLARGIAALDDEALWSRMRAAERRLLPAFDPTRAMDTLERFLASLQDTGPGVAG